MLIWRKIAELLKREPCLALVTVVEAQGSSPREAGARMIVLPHGRISGTIGGGALEWQAIGAAEAALARGERAFELRGFSLGPDLGQCCGGRVRVAIEVITADGLVTARDLAEREGTGRLVTLAEMRPPGAIHRRVLDPAEAVGLPPGPFALLPDGALLERFFDDATPLLLFGAGHVGRALVLALAPLPFRIAWIDPRPDAFPERLPGTVEAVQLDDPLTALDAAPDGAFVLVMTHSHALDFDLVAGALGRPHLPHVGLIGSATKRARFLKRLREQGLGEAAHERLVCPIGLTAIRSKEPAAIAAGIAAELLIRRERLALERRPASPAVTSRKLAPAEGEAA